MHLLLCLWVEDDLTLAYDGHQIGAKCQLNLATKIVNQDPLGCKMTHRNAISILTSTLLLSSCAVFVTNDDFGKSWQGQPIDKLQRQWGNPAEVVRSSDGTSEVRYEIFHGGCTYYFTTDAAGKIVGYRYEVNGLGGSCKPIG